MNKTFKVARSLTRGTVVTSEKASSYQGKAVKTVIAAAVASLVAGVAMAAPAAGDIQITDSTLTVQGQDKPNTTETLKGITAWDATAEEYKAVTQGSQLTGDKNYDLVNGNIVVEPKADVAGSFTVNTLTGTGGLTIKATNQTAEAGSAAVNSTLTITSDNLAAQNDNKAQTVTVTFEGTNAVTAGKDRGVSTLKLADTVALGLIDTDDASKNDTVALVVKDNAKAVVEAATKLDLNNVVLQNAGILTFQSAEINVNSSLDTTADAGDLVFDGATTVAKNFAVKGTNVYVGAYDDKTTEATKELAGDATTFFTGNVTMNGGLEAAKLTVNSSTATVAVGGTGVATVDTLNVVNGTFTVNGNGTDDGVLNVTSALNVAKDGLVTLGGKSNIAAMTVEKGVAADKVTSTGTTAIETLKIGTAADSTEAAANMKVDGGTFSASDVTVGTGHVADTFTVNTAKALTLDKVDVAKSATFTLTAADKATLGSVNAQGAVSIGGKETKVNSLTVAENNTSVTITGADAKVTLDTVSIGKSATVAAKNASVTLGTLTTEGADTTLGKFTVSGGSLTTAYSNVLDGAYDATTLAAQKNLTISDNADVTLTGAADYTTAQYAKAKTVLNGVSTLHLKGGKFVGADDAKGALKEVKSVGNDVEKSDVVHQLETEGTTVAIDNTVISEGAVVGSIEVKQAKNSTKKFTSVVIGGADGTAAGITLRGDANGDLVIVADASKDSGYGLTLNKVTLGQIADDFGTLNETVTVGKDGVTVAAGNFTLGNIAAGDAAAKVEVKTAGLTILGDNTLSFKDAAGATYTPLSIGYKKGTTETEQMYSGNLAVTGGYLALGNYEAQAKVKLAELQADYEADLADPTAAGKVGLLYVGQQTKIAATPTVAGKDAAPSYAYIDLGNVASVAGYDKTQGIVATQSGDITVDTVILDNLSSKVVSTIKVANKDVDVINVGNVTSSTGEYQFTNDYWYTGSTADVPAGQVKIDVKETNVYDLSTFGFNTWNDVSDAIYNYDGSSNPIANTIYQKMGSWEEAFAEELAQKLVDSGLLSEGTTLKTVLETDYFTDDSSNTNHLADLLAAGVDQKELWAYLDANEDAFVNSLVNAEHAATNMAALGGAFSASLDAQNEVVGAINRRLSKANVNAVRGEVGVTPWVDVFGTTNEAKRLYGSNAGYEADIYGAVLGFDDTASCGGTLGVAFNIGTGDGNSVGAGQKVENDQDFYGVSLYAAKEFGGFNTMLDLGYMTVENDLSTSSAFFGKTSEKLDADLFTVSLGAEYALDAGVAKVTPHAGIRMTRLSMDDSKYGAEYDDMTVYQLPLGVAVSSTFETNGWKLAPMVDVSVVPTFGDKDAVATFTGGITDTVRVVDTNPVQGTLGLEAQNGAFTFGLNYRLTAGGDDRMNNSFNANVRYAF